MVQSLFPPEAARIESPLRIPEPPAYSPYADAWKEFDRLDKFMHGRGIYRHLRAAFEWLLFGGAGFLGITISKHHGGGIFAVWGMLIVFDLAVGAILKNRFKHWPCPRCHAEWPGTAKQKDPACKMCGLRLHQLTP
jgi:hypothetical protein